MDIKFNKTKLNIIKLFNTFMQKEKKKDDKS